MEPDWSNLPREIIEIISLKITSTIDYVRFRAVCIVWRSILPREPRNLLQLPWLMLPQNPNKNGGNYDSTLLFYDVSNSKMHTINLPEIRGKELSPSSQGWLTLQNGPQISLFNPITRAQIHLPSLKSSPNLAFKPLLPSYMRCKLGIWPLWYSSKKCTDPIVRKTILISINPSLESKGVVMAMLKNNWGLAFCKIGDECWTLLDEPSFHEDHKVLDATYRNKLFYTISKKEVKIYNMDGSRREVVKIDLPLDLAECYLLDGRLDKLLLVAENKKGEFSMYEVRKEGQPSWIEVKNIGEEMIFLCKNHQCFSFTTENLKLKGWKGNMLCFAKPFTRKHKNSVEFEYIIDMIDLTSREVTRVAKSLGSYNNGLWFTPSFH